MSSICSCKYPLMIIDRRDSTEVTYLSFPDEFIDEMGGVVESPDIDTVKMKGENGILGEYVEVKWKLTAQIEIKTYYINDHIIHAGCDNEKLLCDKKVIYSVFHPIDEWASHHIVILEPIDNVQIK